MFRYYSILDGYQILSFLFIRPDRHLYLDVLDKINLTIAEDNFKIINITDYDMTLKVRIHV